MSKTRIITGLRSGEVRAYSGLLDGLESVFMLGEAQTEMSREILRNTGLNPQVTTNLLDKIVITRHDTLGPKALNVMEALFTSPSTSEALKTTISERLADYAASTDNWLRDGGFRILEGAFKGEAHPHVTRQIAGAQLTTLAYPLEQEPDILITERAKKIIEARQGT